MTRESGNISDACGPDASTPLERTCIGETLALPILFAAFRAPFDRNVVVERSSSTRFLPENRNIIASEAAVNLVSIRTHRLPGAAISLESTLCSQSRPPP